MLRHPSFYDFVLVELVSVFLPPKAVDRLAKQLLFAPEGIANSKDSYHGLGADLFAEVWPMQPFGTVSVPVQHSTWSGSDWPLSAIWSYLRL